MLSAELNDLFAIRPLIWIGLEHLVNESNQLRMQFVWLYFGIFSHLNFVPHLVMVVSPEWEIHGDQFIQNAPKRPNIRLFLMLPIKGFRCLEVGELNTILGCVLLQITSDPDFSDFYLVIVTEQDVTAFEFFMDYSLFVQRREPVQNLLQDVYDFVKLEFLSSLNFVHDLILQASASAVLCDNYDLLEVMVSSGMDNFQHVAVLDLLLLLNYGNHLLNRELAGCIFEVQHFGHAIQPGLSVPNFVAG